METPQTITATQTEIITEFQKFEKIAESDLHIYFGDVNESDDNANVLMYWKSSLELLSNNYFASEGFLSDVLDGSLTWVNPTYAENIAIILKEYQE